MKGVWILGESRLPENAVAVVTGASRGIGRACLLALAKMGYRPVGVARFKDGHDDLVAEVNQIDPWLGPKNEPRFLALACDFLRVDLDSLADWVFEKAEAFGPVAVLVNAAGITHDGLFMNASKDKWANWREVMTVNFEVPTRLMHKFLPEMSRRRFGRIINITSVAAHHAQAGQSNYVVSKAALEALTRVLAREYGNAKRNIKLNAVAPGVTDTEMVRKLDPD